MSDVKLVNYADAARIGMRAKPRTIGLPDPRLDAILDCLEVVTSQWRRELGWKVEFKVELHNLSRLARIYHLSARRIYNWWQISDNLSEIYKYLGTIVFWTKGTDSGWTSPVGSPLLSNFKFEDLSELPQSLNKFFSSPEVGQILVTRFGKAKLPKIVEDYDDIDED
jgi:hypothetical protein